MDVNPVVPFEGEPGDVAARVAGLGHFEGTEEVLCHAIELSDA